MKYLIPLALFIFLLSCSKDEDTEVPKITFMSPQREDTIPVGQDSVLVQFRLDDNKNLSQFSYVLKDSFDKKYAYYGKFISGNTYTYSKWVVFGGFSGVQKLWLQIKAYDQSYNVSEYTKIVYVKP